MIHVSYDLDRQADITLFFSTDGGKTFTELHRVSGDVGKNISAGHRTIVWDVLSERDRLVGEDIVFKVKADGATLTFTVNGVSFTMVAVPGGTFQMGATGDGDILEGCVHTVTLSDYYMGETVVTQALWRAVMGSNPSYFRGDNLPVERVSYDEIVNDFLPKLNRLTGKNFRLPTEAEWEYAARGGKSGGTKYAGSNNIDEVAWYSGNSGKQTHPVKSKQPNTLGLYDMSGNVYEWCSDWFDVYGSASQMNPKGPYFGSSRVWRGGCWCSNAWSCRVSRRNANNPDSRYNTNGFRLSLVP
ncbi:MAG: formylglycine-generating enzyme family protein [Bacteroidales bacterium]|nr:formylglycine-generating enzyme family protein [Bacteroidales bacterium]